MKRTPATRRPLLARLRRPLWASILVTSLASAAVLLPALALAEEGAEHAAAHGAEGAEHAAHAGGAEHGGVPLPDECPTALTEAADHECLEYWENHINWFSWDYKAGPEQAPEHRHMAPPFFFALINFGVFFWIMWRLAAKPLAEYVRTRHLTIRKDLDEAQAIFREAEARLGEYNARIASLDGEIDALLKQVRAEAEAEKGRIITEAQAQAVRLKHEAESQIQVELRRMRRELKVEAVSAAIAAAEQILATKVSADDQSRLTERFATELERAPTTPTARS